MKNYEMSAQEVLSQVKSDHGGLSGSEASARLAKFGQNKLKGAEKCSALQLFVELCCVDFYFVFHRF